jgi:hypothetical protein
MHNSILNMFKKIYFFSVLIFQCLAMTISTRTFLTMRAYQTSLMRANRTSSMRTLLHVRFPPNHYAVRHPVQDPGEITRSGAEDFALLTARTSSMRYAADFLSTVGNVSFSNVMPKYIPKHLNTSNYI